MPRKLKPYKVDTVTNRQTGITVDILLDRNDTPAVFYGMVGPIRIQAATDVECQKLVRRALKDYTGLEWKKFIILAAEKTGHDWIRSGYKTINAGLSLAFHRLQGAKTVDGTWTSKPFDEDVVKHTAFTDDYHMRQWYRDGDDVTIPYSEKVWATLLEMKCRIDTMGKFLEDLLKTKDLVGLLSSRNATRLLSAGQSGGLGQKDTLRLMKKQGIPG